MENLTDKEKIQKSKIANELNNAEANQDIFKKYTERAKEETKKGNKTLIISLIVIGIATILCIVVPLISLKIESNIEKSEERDVPNLEGKTFGEAQRELENLDLKLKANNESSDAIITHQYDKYKKKKGDTVEVATSTKEEIAQKEEKQRKENEESGNRSRANSEFAKTVERANNGSVKYYLSSYYGSTEKSGKVYKLKYTTSYDYQYYYQLVSYNSDYTAVIKSTKLFLFSDYGYGESGQTQELEYAYKNTF